MHVSEYASQEQREHADVACVSSEGFSVKVITSANSNVIGFKPMEATKLLLSRARHRSSKLNQSKLVALVGQFTVE